MGRGDLTNAEWVRLEPHLHAVQAEADLAGKLDWTMVGVDSTTCRTHQHAAGARKTTPRVPKKGPRLGTTVPTRGSAGTGAA